MNPLEAAVKIIQTLPLTLEEHLYPTPAERHLIAVVEAGCRQAFAEAIQSQLSAPTRQAWTREAPTVTGFYFRRDDETKIVTVGLVAGMGAGAMWRGPGANGTAWVDEMPPGEWQGPISPAVDQPAESRRPNVDEVICPACTHQFRAIPMDVQHEVAELRKGWRQLTALRNKMDHIRAKSLARRKALRQLTKAHDMLWKVLRIQADDKRALLGKLNNAVDPTQMPEPPKS